MATAEIYSKKQLTISPLFHSCWLPVMGTLAKNEMFRTIWCVPAGGRSTAWKEFLQRLMKLQPSASAASCPAPGKILNNPTGTVTKYKRSSFLDVKSPDNQTRGLMRSTDEIQRSTWDRGIFSVPRSNAPPASPLNVSRLLVPRKRSNSRSNVTTATEETTKYLPAWPRDAFRDADAKSALAFLLSHYPLVCRSHITFAS